MSRYKERCAMAVGSNTGEAISASCRQQKVYEDKASCRLSGSCSSYQPGPVMLSVHVKRQKTDDRRHSPPSRLPHAAGASADQGPLPQSCPSRATWNGRASTCGWCAVLPLSGDGLVAVPGCCTALHVACEPNVPGPQSRLCVAQT